MTCPIDTTQMCSHLAFGKAAPKVLEGADGICWLWTKSEAERGA